MQTIKLNAHIGEDGLLKLELPVSMPNRDVEVLVVLQPMESRTADDLGWPTGFFEKTYGILKDNPITREPQGDYEVRDEIE